MRGIGAGDYEVIVLDAGSVTPLEENFVKSFGENFRLVRSKATPSPGVANWNEQKLRRHTRPQTMDSVTKKPAGGFIFLTPHQAVARAGTGDGCLYGIQTQKSPNRC